MRKSIMTIQEKPGGSVDALQKLSQPEVLDYVTVSKTAKARKALKKQDREFDTQNGYYRIRTTASERNRMRQGKLTRLELLHELGVY